MKIVFFGTPDYVVPIAESLYKNLREKGGISSLVAVVTQAPKPAGREGKLNYSGVDNWAFKKNVSIYFEPEKLIEEGVKADIGILASYGQIISKNILGWFPYGILNIHPSGLPLFRGSSPVQATIITGSKPVVSIIKLDEKMDHGPIVSHFKDELLETDTTESLRARLFERSAEVLKTLIPAYISGKTKPKEQDHSKASFTRELKKEDGFIPPEYLAANLKGDSLQGLPTEASAKAGMWEIPFIFNKIPNPNDKIPIKKPLSIKPSALNIYNFIQAMEPWPTCWTTVQLNPKSQLPNSKRLKILKAHLEESYKSSAISHQLLVLDEVQLEGKNPVSWKQFMEGYPEAKFMSSRSDPKSKPRKGHYNPKGVKLSHPAGVNV
jgi:methionyl-tRNA formyltransferase